MDGRGWAEQPGGFAPYGEWTADPGNAVDVGLRELSQRLDQLLISVERLGVEDHWSATPPPPAPVYGGWADPYGRDQPSWRTWEPEPGYLPTPIEPAAWEQSFDPPTVAWVPDAPPANVPECVPKPPQAIAPEWVAEPPQPSAPAWVPEPPPSNSHAPLIEVASLDAGPFADLIELRHFEEALGELARVRSVRVRRFGHHRASIEVAVSSAPLLEHELQLLDREMSVGATPEGEVVVELVPPLPSTRDEGAEVNEELKHVENGE